MFTALFVLCFFSCSALAEHPIDEIDGYGQITKSDSILLYRSDDMCNERRKFIHSFDPRCNRDIDSLGRTWYYGNNEVADTYCADLRCLKSLGYIKLKNIRKCNIEIGTTPIPASSFTRRNHTLDHIVEIKICDTPYAAKDVPHALQISESISDRLHHLKENKKQEL